MTNKIVRVLCPIRQRIPGRTDHGLIVYEASYTCKTNEIFCQLGLIDRCVGKKKIGGQGYDVPVELAQYSVCALVRAINLSRVRDC